MEITEISAIVERILERAIKEPKKTGKIDILINCSQGHTRPPRIVFTDKIGRVSIFDYDPKKGDLK